MTTWVFMQRNYETSLKSTLFHVNWHHRKTEHEETHMLPIWSINMTLAATSRTKQRIAQWPFYSYVAWSLFSVDERIEIAYSIRHWIYIKYLIFEDILIQHDGFFVQLTRWEHSSCLLNKFCSIMWVQPPSFVEPQRKKNATLLFWEKVEIS